MKLYFFFSFNVWLARLRYECPKWGLWKSTEGCWVRWPVTCSECSTEGKTMYSIEKCLHCFLYFLSWLEFADVHSVPLQFHDRFRFSDANCIALLQNIIFTGLWQHWAFGPKEPQILFSFPWHVDHGSTPARVLGRRCWRQRQIWHRRHLGWRPQVH